jgi:hypothetical protein
MQLVSVGAGQNILSEVTHAHSCTRFQLFTRAGQVEFSLLDNTVSQCHAYHVTRLPVEHGVFSWQGGPVPGLYFVVSGLLLIGTKQLGVMDHFGAEAITSLVQTFGAGFPPEKAPTVILLAASMWGQTMKGNGVVSDQHLCLSFDPLPCLAFPLVAGNVHIRR